MPLLEIASPQPNFQNHLGALRPQALVRGRLFSSSFAFGNDKRLAFTWKSSNALRKIQFETCQTRFVVKVKAVATLEVQLSTSNEDVQVCDQNSWLAVDSSPSGAQIEPSSDNEDGLDDREKLRRMRISNANRGNTPWNKGRKHSPETLRKIRERTRLAMQNPKIKMKLINLGHAQSEETKVKIGVGVRLGWQRRRERLLVQDTCFYEWQNLIAEASRKGYIGEEELQWDSYDKLNARLERVWYESVEQRKSKTTPRPKGSRRAPKSPEQRRKIAAAIAAKWADPEYRERVCSGLAKYHGTPVGVERKPRRKPSDGTSRTRSTKRSSSQRKSSSMVVAPQQNPQTHIQRLRLKRSNVPRFKDPLADSKLEMIKSIRAQRAAVETNKTEAIERARLLIAEAEKAAKALEAAAMASPVARASLLETRKLIAEAIQSIASIEKEAKSTDENSTYAAPPSPDLIVGEETETVTGGMSQLSTSKINGTHAETCKDNDQDFNFNPEFRLRDMLDEEGALKLNGSSLVPFSLEDQSDYSTEWKDQLEPNRLLTGEKSRLPPNGTASMGAQSAEHVTCSGPITVTKKWVRGRLVEVTD